MSGLHHWIVNLSLLRFEWRTPSSGGRRNGSITSNSVEWQKIERSAGLRPVPAILPVAGAIHVPKKQMVSDTSSILRKQQ